MGGSHTGVLIPSSPCPHYLCLNMPRLSCVSLRVCYLSCSAKHPASMAAKLPVWPSPPAPLDSLLPGSCTECTFYFFALGCPWYCEPTSSAASACGRWVRSPTHPFPRSSLGGVWRRGGGALLAARARTPGSARARARAPRLQPNAPSGFRCHCLLPGAAAGSKLGFCPLGRLPRGRKTSSKRMPGPVSTATAAGRAGTERGRKMVFGLMTLPAGGSEP